MFAFFYSPFVLAPLKFPCAGKFKKLGNFYMTFTDALHSVFDEFQIKPTDTVLMPDFYCPSTLKNISKRATVKFYHVRPDFTVDRADYFTKLRTLKPKAVVNYGYSGFSLTGDEGKKLKEICGNQIIVIDDCAHRILTDSDIHFISDRHFYIDSCRKHSAFFGSHLIRSGGKSRHVEADSMNLYKFKLLALQFIENFLNFWTYIFSSRFLYGLSTSVFLASDHIAGTSERSTRGSALDYFQYNFLSLKRIKEHHKKLATHYNQAFSKLKSPFISTLPNEMVEKGEFNYYPLFVSSDKRLGLIQFLAGHKIFADVLWESSTLPEEFKNVRNDAMFDSFIVFPLTLLVKERHIDIMAKRVGEYLNLNR